MRVLRALLDFVGEVVADSPGPSAAKLRGTIDLSPTERLQVRANEPGTMTVAEQRVSIRLDDQTDAAADRITAVIRVSRTLW